MQASNHSFIATADKGKVSAIFLSPAKSIATLVLGHGAGADMRHAHMQAIANSLAAAGIATLRFNFPYMEAGGKRTDSKGICTETIGNALICANQLGESSTLLLGGHSFGGRMASHFVAESNPDIAGLIYYSFPLHPAGKPGTSRADHLKSISIPQLFLSGTHDRLADLTLLRGVVTGLKQAKIHELDTADHSFRILKRSRESAEDVYKEVARVTAEFAETVTGR